MRQQPHNTSRRNGDFGIRELGREDLVPVEKIGVLEVIPRRATDKRFQFLLAQGIHYHIVASQQDVRSARRRYVLVLELKGGITAENFRRPFVI